MSIHNTDRSKLYLNPYFGGFLLGLIIIATFYITGRGLGASGASKSTVVSAMHTIAPEHAEESQYYSQFLSDNKHPLNTWMIFEVLGMFVGAFLSGALSGRLKLKVEHPPQITSKRRIAFALLGGILFGFGSQIGRGCTSGAALSGMSVLSSAGFLTMIMIFGTAFVFAWVFRKNWI